jgi:diguanylate cyclase (GGDEF)-like protein/PAS domain S-box-containing protein
LDQSNRIRAVFGAGFAVLLGVGIAAVFQTFVWEDSVTLVARTYEMLNRLDRIAYSSEAAEAAGLRYVSTADGGAATECRQDLAIVHNMLANLGGESADGPVFRSLRANLAELLDQQYMAIRSALDSPPSAMRQMMAARDSSGARTELRTAIQNLHADLRQTLDERIAYQAGTAHRARRLFLTSGLICAVLIVIAGWQFSLDPSRREIFRRPAALRNQQFRQAVELATDMVFRLDDQGRFTYCNPVAMQLLHFGEQEIIGRSYTKLVRVDMRREVEHFYLRQTTRKRRSSYYEIPIVDGHGRERWVGQSVQMLMEGDKLTGFQAIARDITERKRAEADLARRHAFVEGIAAATPGILYVFDLVDRKTVFSNRDIGVVLGYKQEEAGDFDQVVMRLVHPDDLSALRLHQETLRRARNGDIQRIEYRARHADGNWVWLSAWETPFTWEEDGRVRQIVGIAQDVTAHNTARERLTWQANYDTLTRLANRQHFWTRLQNLLRRASMDNSPVSLCLFDIDLFKEINDRFGHAAGDEVLEAIGTIVRSELRSEDASGRLGGDEFCFVLPNVDQEEAARLAERIRERLNTMAFGMNGGSPFTASATFGVAAWQSQMSARELMEAADRALYRAKASGRNRVCVDA